MWHFPSHTIHQDIFRASDPSQLFQGTPFSSNVLWKSTLAQLAPASGHARNTLPSESLWMDTSEQVLSLLLHSWQRINVSTWGPQLSQNCSVEQAGLKTSDQTIVCCAWEHVHFAGVSLAAELREYGFRHDALHLCTSSCSFLPAGLSAHTFVPSLHSCPPSPPCRHSHSSCVPAPFLLCSLATGTLSSRSWCLPVSEDKDRALRGVNRRRCTGQVLVTETPATSLPCFVTRNREQEAFGVPKKGALQSTKSHFDFSWVATFLHFCLKDVQPHISQQTLPRASAFADSPCCKAETLCPCYLLSRTVASSANFVAHAVLHIALLLPLHF